MLITLDAVAESIDAVPRRADALTPGHASDVEERARTSEHDGLSHLDSAAHVIGVLREAVLGNDAELLSNLSLVAESLSRKASAATLAGGVPANVRLIVGPSMDTADALDETEVPRVEEAARFSDDGVAEGRS